MRGGESEDVHEIVESIVIRKAGLKSGGRMHTARSRNDQVSLDMRMKMRDDILGICGGILDCTNLLLKMAENTSAGIEFVSAPNLVKKLDINDSVLAVLRYKIK